MPRWASKIIIAGIDFTGCRGLIINGAELTDDVGGSVEYAADGTPHIQTVTVGKKGHPFGISMPNIEASKISSARTAIKTAEAAQEAVEVWFTDALDDIHVLAYPDYSQRPWFSHGPESEGMIQDVTFKFISVAAAP